MLRVFFQIFKKLYHFTNIYSVQYITEYRSNVSISVWRVNKTISLANGDSIAKVSIEGWCVCFPSFIYIYISNNVREAALYRE